jgi:hypothetical protein
MTIPTETIRRLPLPHTQLDAIEAAGDEIRARVEGTAMAAQKLSNR